MLFFWERFLYNHVESIQMMWIILANLSTYYVLKRNGLAPTGVRPGSVGGPHPGSLGARLGALLSSCFESCSMSCIKRSPGDRYHLVMTNIYGKIMKDPPCSMGESTISVYFYGHVQQLWDKLPEGTVTSLKSKRDFGNKHGGSSYCKYLRMLQNHFFEYELTNFC